MRMTQYIGLTNKATDWLKEHNSKVLCEYVGATGMFDEPLMYRIHEVQEQYPCPYCEDNDENMLYDTVVKTVVEFTQAVPWSSGPMYFVALKDICTGKVIEESLWDEEEFGNY